MTIHTLEPPLVPMYGAGLGLPVRRAFDLATVRRLWPFEHPRQPYESWWSNRHETFRWPAGRFFSAPVPSGCTLMTVLSVDIASILMWMICCSCSATKIRSSTPALAQRFIRVWIVCQLPNRRGRPLHLQSCSATYKIAFITRRLEMPTLPRSHGKQASIRRYCSSVISITHYTTSQHLTE